jgi:integrase
MSLYKRGKTYWYKFVWRGELIRESTRQSSQRVARQMEAADKVARAKGEVGIREKTPVPTLAEFAEVDFLPFVRTTFQKKPKTQSYYANGVKNLLRCKRLAGQKLDAITTDQISAYVQERQNADGKHGKHLQVASINRELQVLRRMFTLAQEWRKAEKALPKVTMIPGEAHRERVLSDADEALYFRGAATKAMERYADPALLRDVATILLDCGLRPEECFRLQRGNVTADYVEVHFGKTENARRQILTTPRTRAVLDMRLGRAGNGPWVFPANTKSGHIEPSTLKKQHQRAQLEAARILREETGDKNIVFAPFELYTLRHTCLTRWAPHMDPWTLAYLAGHRDMNTTKRYVHPQEKTVREAMNRARTEKATPEGRHKNRHNEAELESIQIDERKVTQ